MIEKTLLEQAKERIADNTADIIAEVLGVEKYDSKNKKGCCPFHSENTPSFIYSPKTLKYHCFGACNKSVDIVDAFIEGKNMTFNEAAAKVFELAGMEVPMGEVGVKTEPSYKYPTEVKCDDKSQVYEYWAKRKISQSTIDYCDVRQDDHGNTVFNYYDTNDVLCLVKYRPSRKIDKSKGDLKAWCQKGADTMPLLWNMNRINVTQPLLIVEGEGDCMSAIESGYLNTVSVCFGAGNYTWIEKNFDWLEQFDTIIICADNDEAGEKMRKECVFRLGSWRCKVVNMPRYVELDGKKIKIKDLNEVLYYMGKEKVMEVISNASDTPVDSVIDYTDVTSVDLDAIDGIKTGFREIDQKLMKIFYSTFNILTGVNGSGKSSFISQLICQSVEQGKPVWYYSGELPNFQSRGWCDYIFAGQRNVVQRNVGDTEFWKVTPEARKAINDAYKEKIFIYKDGQSHKVPDLIESMVECIRKFGVKLLVIDNLTSVNLECNENNKYSKQEEFVTQLIDLAKKYNVAVILVVHPHKIETMRRLTKMDVQGISAIIDLAHRIISLYRVTEEDKKGVPKKNGNGWFKPPIKSDVMVDILKDRMLGFEGSSVGLFYDRPSRRFFTNEFDLDYQYSFDKREKKGGLPFYPKQLMPDTAEQEVFGA